LLAVTSPILFDLTKYEAGGEHLIPLLFLALPGIDANDYDKTYATLFFIRTAISSVELVDYSEYESFEGESECHLRCRIQTSEFETWIVQFLEKVFVYVMIF
jgi:proteasome activator subunit 4